MAIVALWHAMAVAMARDGDSFEVVTPADNHPPHSEGRLCSVRVVAHKKPGASHRLDKDKILQTYEARQR